MRNFFALCVLLSLMTFKVFSQDKDSYFVNDTWENVVKLAEKKNQMIMVYIYSDYKNCNLCKELDETTFSNKEILQKLSEKVVLYKVSFNSVEKSFRKKYDLTESPSLLFVSNKYSFSSKFKLSSSDINLEEKLERVQNSFLEIDESQKIFIDYEQNRSNKPDAIKNYLLRFINCQCKIDTKSILEEYLQKIPINIQENSETLEIILKSGFYIDKLAIDILLRQLQNATTQQNLYLQHYIKSNINKNLIESVNNGTLENKINLKIASIISEKCKEITPNFSNYETPLLELNYHASAKNKDRFMTIAKDFLKNNSFDKNQIVKMDTVFNLKIDDFINNKNTLSEFQISELKLQKNYYSENISANLNFIAKVILFQQINQKNIELGIKCSEKALELAPNASRYAIYGLLLNKNEHYKLAYEMLARAIELEADNSDKIDLDVKKECFSTFLEIKKRIPENY